MSKLAARLFINAGILGLSLLFFLPPVFAARSLNIESDEPSFTNDEEKEIRVALGGFTEGESVYIKGAFSLPDSTNYFGYTKKSDEWVKNSTTATDQLSVKAGEWDGKLTVKPDFADTGFKGTGNYNFKVGFYYYSNAGNLSSVNWSNIQTASITFIPTPTPTPIPTPTETPVPTSVPTAVPTVKITPSATAKPLNSPTIYLSPVFTKVIATITSGVTSVADVKFGKNDSTGTVLGEMKETPDSHDNSLSIFLLIFSGGLLFIGAAAAISYKQMRSNKKGGTSSG